MTPEQIQQLVAQIAKEQLGIKTLRPRNSDHYDFHDVSVWSVERALTAAFEAGRASK